MASPERHRPPGDVERRIEARLVVGRAQAAGLGRPIRRAGILGVPGGFECPPAGDGKFGVLAEPGLERGDLEQEIRVAGVARGAAMVTTASRSSVRPAARRSWLRSFFARGAFASRVPVVSGTDQESGDGGTNGSRGKPASATRSRKSARSRSGSKSRSSNPKARSFTGSISSALRRHATARARSCSPCSGET